MKLKIFHEHSYKEYLKEIISKIKSGHFSVYLFGANNWAEDIMQYIDVEAIIDEFASEGSIFKDKKVISNLNFIDLENSIVISCILGRPWTIKQKLDNLGVLNIDYFSFWRFSELNLIDSRNWRVFNSSFNLEKYTQIFNALEDLESKRTLENILNFRKTQDLSFIKFYTDRQYYQYFEPFLNLSDETFIDIGGYDGFTSDLFIKLTPNYNGVKFFEPEVENLNKSKKRLGKFGNKVEFFQNGMGNKIEKLTFSASGSTSGVDPKGEKIININTLDNLFYSSVNSSNNLYIKMDIEGWEMNALIGGEKLIKKYKPKLAVCVYHKPNDIMDIYQYVISLNPNYKVYLRHYTEGVDETVMYFVPDEK